MRCNSKTRREARRRPVLRAHDCEEMADMVADTSSMVTYWSKTREFGVYYPQQSSIKCFAFCPFCGAELPPSLRDLRHERLRAMGLEPCDKLPPEYGDDSWWLGDAEAAGGE